MVGSLSGNFGKGAGIGAGVGALGGAATETARWQRAYRRAYDDCIAQRSGRRTYYRAAPEPWTAAWYDYCASRYRSFDPDTGYYYYKPGKRRFCR
ncbi:MAG: BA14K family protein [Hyphomicrobiales bacterium]|nr:BA14K family protein [Hyphomicrobiales bacterium]